MDLSPTPSNKQIKQNSQQTTKLKQVKQSFIRWNRNPNTSIANEKLGFCKTTIVLLKVLNQFTIYFYLIM